MTNPQRGEFLLKIANQEINTKVNLDSIVRMETALKNSIVRVMQSVASGDVRADEIATILHIAIRGGGNDWDRKRVESLIWEAGLVDSMKAVADVLTGALMPDGNSGNSEAVEQK